MSKLLISGRQHPTHQRHSRMSTKWQLQNGKLSFNASHNRAQKAKRSGAFCGPSLWLY
ncbi:MAG: hypothetical protein PSU93_15410 [Methylobacter sp.]|uniref:Uncharacterized protein n=1 Tax=Candidatus Methylobacter titanis TaxID=3053457 RepID=A0AA43QA08_9GAMM|nr:hypothetical protein [Candidatus Methylobacter titanis]